MMWPFTRKPKPTPPPVVDHQNWRIGDMAECLSVQGWADVQTGQHSNDGPKTGDRMMVSGVEMGRRDDRIYLCFVGDRGNSYASVYFRKIILMDIGIDRVVDKRLPVRA